jgi:hypothetical protein
VAELVEQIFCRKKGKPMIFEEPPRDDALAFRIAARA